MVLSKKQSHHPLPIFSGCMIEEVPEPWIWGPLAKLKKKRLPALLQDIMFLRSHGLRGSSVIGAYHARRVAPPMACTLSLYAMAPSMDFRGTMLTMELLAHSEVAQRVKEATDESVVFPILRRWMWPVRDAIKLPTDVSIWSFIAPL